MNRTVSPHTPTFAFASAPNGEKSAGKRHGSVPLDGSVVLAMRALHQQGEVHGLFIGASLETMEESSFGNQRNVTLVRIGKATEKGKNHARRRADELALNNGSTPRG